MPEGFLDLRRQTLRPADDVGEEGRTEPFDFREHLACGVRQRAGLVWTRRHQRLGILAREQCDRRELRRPNALDALALGSRQERGMRRQASPHHVARVTELVQEAALIARDARGQYGRLPRRGGYFQTLELPDDMQRALDPVQSRGRGHVLPAEEEAHVVGRADGLDLASQRAEREPVNAGEHAPVAPLVARAGEASADHLAFGFEPNQRAFDRAFVERERGRQSRDRHRTARFEMSAHDLGNGFVTFFGHPQARRQRLHGGRRGRAGICDECEAEPLRGRPQRHGVGADVQRRHPARRRQFVEPALPRRLRLHDDQREQRVVQFVGIAHERPRRLRHLGDCRRIEQARCVGVEARRLTQRHRARAPLFERCIVEIGIRIGVEDFVTEGRRLRRVDRNGADLARFDATENREESVEVHCLL